MISMLIWPASETHAERTNGWWRANIQNTQRTRSGLGLKCILDFPNLGKYMNELLKDCYHIFIFKTWRVCAACHREKRVPQLIMNYRGWMLLLINMERTIVFDMSCANTPRTTQFLFDRVSGVPHTQLCDTLSYTSLLMLRWRYLLLIHCAHILHSTLLGNWWLKSCNKFKEVLEGCD